MSDDELQTIAAPYEGKYLAFEELEQLRQELSLYYADKGYLNSGIIIPDQQVEDETLFFKVVEGSLNEINIQGNNYFSEDYIASRINIAAKTPVNVGKLQEALLILQEDSRIKRINADFKQGAALGEGVLNVSIEEASPYLVSAFFDNDVSPSTGEYRSGMHLAHTNVLGLGDILAVQAEFTDGKQEYQGRYSVPVTARDTTVEFNCIEGQSQVVETPFKDLAIESDSDTYGLRLRQPVYRRPGKEFAIALAGELRRSKTYLLGRPFSFSAGAVDGESKESVLRFSQEWVDRDQSTIIAAHSTFSLGIDAFDATVQQEDLPDGKFFTWIGQGLLAHKLHWLESQCIFKANFQLANDRLFSLEQFSLGGFNSVRG